MSEGTQICGTSYPQKAVDWLTCPRINGDHTGSYPRINGDQFTHKRRPPNKSLYLLVINTLVVGAAPNGDKSATCHPNGLHLLPTAINKWTRKGNQCQKS
jgi:hypothetical protein